jgi:putative methyltransferase (TIGR04325 family)
MKAGGAKTVLRSITPPALVSGARAIRRRVAPRTSPLRQWEYVPEGWSRARTDPAVSGWDVAEVVEAYRAKLAAFRDAIAGPGALADPTSAGLRGGALSIDDQNAILVFGYALALASRHSETVSILDWGGGIGVFYLLSKALLPDDVDVRYHCKDLPGVCASGQEVLPEVHFHDDESCLDGSYDLVLASNSLQYTEDWHRLVARLARATGRYLLLTRVPVVASAASYVALQRAYRYGLGTEYLGWVFNSDELVGAVNDAGTELVREYRFAQGPLIHGAPEQPETRGFLFRRARF